MNQIIQHWVFLFTDRNTDVYFDSFGIEYILQKVLSKIRNKSISRNIYLECMAMILLCVNIIVSHS